MTKCNCGGKVERINRKKMRCVRCGAEFSAIPTDSRRKRTYQKNS